ncbi:MAG: hypothetical protein IPJ65_39890 [Archangiaceae bacterium]|nr:hypothetical protein [Archangiaceae bacterium]
MGPVSIAVPEGFLDDVDRAGKLARGGAGSLSSQGRVWVNAKNKMQLALSLARLPHQPEWDKVSSTVLLTEMVNQELAAGEKASLKTVSSDRKWQGAVLHYSVEGDMGGQLSTVSHTALWVDAAGDCWHASAVCTARPTERQGCTPLIDSVRFDVAGFDAGSVASP